VLRTRSSADLVVVGAGPAGAAAAITAARSGLQVVLCDKAVFPRDKTCGDGLTTAALRRLEHLGLDIAALAGTYEPLHETVLVSPSGRRVVLPLPDDGLHVIVVRRATLDSALVDVARSLGVEVHEGSAVNEVVAGGGSVEVGLADGYSITAPFLVAADGPWSSVRRLLQPGRPPDIGEWHAARQYFSGVAGLAGRIWVDFEADLLPGYSWVFPLPGGRANVGFVVLRESRRFGSRSGKEMHALWHDMLERPIMREVLGPDAYPEDRARAWPIPSRFDPTRLTSGRVLFAGDAAGVVDPMTGEGISQALQTGTLAARRIAEAIAPASKDHLPVVSPGTRGGPRSPHPHSGVAPELDAMNLDAVASRYRRDVERDLGVDLRFAALLRRALQHRKGARLAIRAAGLTPWTRTSFARWMYEDYPRAILLTPGRWHRHMLTGTGAYR